MDKRKRYILLTITEDTEKNIRKMTKAQKRRFYEVMRFMADYTASELVKYAVHTANYEHMINTVLAVLYECATFSKCDRNKLRKMLESAGYDENKIIADQFNKLLEGVIADGLRSGNTKSNKVAHDSNAPETKSNRDK